MSVRNKAFVASANAALRANGGRMTAVQGAVIDLLADAEGPITANAAFERLDEMGRYVPRTAVFRLVDKLLEAGMVIKVGATGGVFRREPSDAGSLVKFPVYFVDTFQRTARAIALENQASLDRDLEAMVRRHGLPDADYHLELVAGRSLLAGAAS